MGFKVSGVFRKIDKDSAEKGAAGCGLERIVLFAEVLGLIHVGSADKITVEAVGPGMIGTGDVFPEFPGVSRAETGSPVPAEVVEGPRLAVSSAHNDDSFLLLGVDEEAALILKG